METNKSQSRTGLTDLPVELIHHICSFLRPTCIRRQRPYRCLECTNHRPGCFQWYHGQPSVSRLSRTCKRLQHIVQPLVFLCYSGNAREQGSRLVRLARTLIERPDLAQYMRFLMVHNLEELTPSEVQFTEETITERFGLPPPVRGWNIDGEGQYRLLSLELVLPHTPNLEYLTLPLDYDWDMNVLSQLQQTGRFSLPKLLSLDVSHYYISGDRFDSSIGSIHTILDAAPNLQFLSLPSPNAASSTAPLTQLRQLDLQSNNTIDPALLSDLLSSSPKLEFFALHWDPLGDAYEYCDDRRVADAWKALESCSESLKGIRLDVRDDTEPGETERDSLKDFERLQVLKVSGHSLKPLRGAWERKNRHARVDSFLSGFFPPNIRRVTLWNLDGVEMKEAMRRFAKVVGVGRYPKLESVVLAPTEKSDRMGFDEWHGSEKWNGIKGELEEEFSKGGVRFEVRFDQVYWCHDEDWGQV